LAKNVPGDQALSLFLFIGSATAIPFTTFPLKSQLVSRQYAWRILNVQLNVNVHVIFSIHISGLLREQYNLCHTCNTGGNLVLLLSFDALRFELKMYERPGCLVLGSDRRGGGFKSIHAASGCGHKRRVCGKQAFTGLLTCRARGDAPMPCGSI
jgi:hypothetical protein